MFAFSPPFLCVLSLIRSVYPPHTIPQGLNRINRDLLSINTNDSTPAADTENLVSVSPIKSGNLVSKISSSDDLRTGYTQGLMKGAVALNVPLSPGGTFHNEWINCVAL